MLQSGTIFAYRLPDVEDIVAKGLIPDELRQHALKFAASAVDPATMDTKELADLLRMMRLLVAQSLRYIWTGPIEPIEAWREFEPGANWQSVTLTLADLEESAIDTDDYAALQGIISRTFTARQITVMSLVEHGLMTQGDADPILAADNARTVSGWSSFREERRRADARPTGGKVARQAVGTRGRKRAASRARAR
jgi:hypothetical protein